MNLNELAKRVHKANEKWWIDLSTGQKMQRSKREMQMLSISELAEALEGDRKNLNDDHLPQYPMAVVELVDFVIRQLDYAAGWGYDLNDYVPHEDGTVTEKFSECLFDICEYCQFVINGPYPDQALFTSIELAIDLSKMFYPSTDFWEVFEAKMEYNAKREDHKLENRIKEGGKKY